MFDNVLGHDKIKKDLENQIKTGDVFHAYVFYGPKGVGKRTLAEEFAKQLLETNNLSNNPDYKYIKKLENKTEIIIEQIREEIIENIYIAPAMSQYKVYIIDGAELLGGASQNAMLKTLEEPPKGVVIIMISSTIDALLPTIISRTNNILFEILNKSQIERILGKDIPDEIFKFSSGNINKIKDMLSEEYKQEYELIKDLSESICKKDKIETLIKLNKLDLKSCDLEYLQYLLLEINKYDAVNLIEESKIKCIQNANENVIKTNLAIKLCK